MRLCAPGLAVPDHYLETPERGKKMETGAKNADKAGAL